MKNIFGRKKKDDLKNLADKVQEEADKYDNSLKAIEEIRRRLRDEKGYDKKLCNCEHRGDQHDRYSYVTVHAYCYLCNCQQFTFRKEDLNEKEKSKNKNA